MKIYCLLGKSAAGKDTILNEIVKKKLLNVIVSSTTRKPRSNEIDGVAYNFISERQFLEKLNKGYFLEHTEYHVATNETWHYGIDKTLLDKDKDYITIVNPDGYRQIKNKLGDENVMGILVKVDDRERLIRSLTRDINANINEVIRRYQADEEDFKDVEKEVKYIIKNTDLQQSVKIVEKIIEKENSISVEEDNLQLGDKVKIIDIKDKTKAGHLTDFIGREGYIFSKIVYKGVTRYKVFFNDNEIYYFRANELEVI